ncbi:MAG: radical SAM protein [Actinomycetia bacterium]|nr:radical SAM protein [Actinomycetes bacterium]
MDYRPTESRSALQRVDGMPFRWSLNPYRGCRHACVYCYARVYHSYIGFDDPGDFDRVVLYKGSLPDVLRRELRRRRGPLDGVVAIGTATDPYQPLEARERLTRRLLGVLLEHGAAVTVTTKSPLVLRDLDLLRQFAAYGGVRVHVTVTVLNESLWHLLEPRTPHPRGRLNAVRRLRDAGIPASVFLAPVVPALGEDEALAVLDAARDAGAETVWADVLRLTPVVREWLLPRLDAQVPAAASVLRRLYGHRDTLAGPVRARILEPIRRRVDALGLGGPVAPPVPRQPLELALFS